MSWQQQSDDQAYLKGQLERRTAPLPENVRQLLRAQEPAVALKWLDDNDDGKAFVSSSTASVPAPVTEQHRALAATAKRYGYDVKPEDIARRQASKGKR